MFVKNGKDNRYSNGTLGVVVDTDVYHVSVKVGDKTIEVAPTLWDNIQYKYDENTNQIQETKVGTFKQIPLKPAWAITIHKSLRPTFDNIIIDIPHAFLSGQSYVALSRCRTLEGVVLKKETHARIFLCGTINFCFL